MEYELYLGKNQTKILSSWELEDQTSNCCHVTSCSVTLDVSFFSDTGVTIPNSQGVLSFKQDGVCEGMNAVVYA